MHDSVVEIIPLQGLTSVVPHAWVVKTSVYGEKSL